VRVPDTAGEGKATVKVSFPGLTTLKVGPSTFEVLIKKAPAPGETGGMGH
jgi:hypothetical protein